MTIPTPIAIFLFVAFAAPLIMIASALLGRRTYRQLAADLDAVDRDPRTTSNDRRIVAGVSSMATSWTVGAIALSFGTLLGFVIPFFIVFRRHRFETPDKTFSKSNRETLYESLRPLREPNEDTIQEMSGVSVEGSWLRGTEILARIWRLSWLSALYAHPFWVIATMVMFVVVWLPWMSILWLFGRTTTGGVDVGALVRSVARSAVPH